ncbi:substrate-binding domain-containing protein [Shouchella miscanthi]|uniref:Substrate-binding domain-containing protein n=1 Tax=Shouchella miscanthi TaxID=2598861 RepID=A0ABU6NEM1_9BACI|nr:substrate-binding domain-containing protein [Shouchella miscanthi]
MFVTKMIRIIVLSTIVFIGFVTVMICAFLGMSIFYLWLLSAATICIVIYVTLMFYQWHRPGFRRMFFLSMIIVGLVSIYTYEQRNNALKTIAEPYVPLEQWEPFHPNRPIEIERAETNLSSDSIRITGQAFLYPLYSSFVEATFSSVDPSYARQVLDTASRPLDSLGNDTIAFVPEYLLPADHSVEPVPIAKDAFVFFTHQEQEVETISRDQVQSIYTGALSNWSQVGGATQAIRQYQRKEEDSQEAFEWFMEESSQTDPTTPYVNVQNAIGFTFYSNYQFVEDTNQTKLLAIDHVAPSQQTLESHEYPIPITVYAVTSTTPNDEVTSFIEWIQSEEAQTVIESVGFSPIQEGEHAY